MVTATQAIVKSLMSRAEGVDQKLYMHNFPSSPDISDALDTRAINCYGIIR
jgi:hypothetical protein